MGDVVVVCGAGNNGGDGYVAARLLRDAAGATSACSRTADPAELQGDAQANPSACRASRRARSTAPALEGAAVVVDALLGTGFSGEPRGAVAAAIAAINALRRAGRRAPTCRAASTRRPARSPATAVRAVATATFHAAKPGLWVSPASRTPGEVRVIDIGIPRRRARCSRRIGLIERRGARRVARARGRDSTKFTSGHVLVAGGSRGLTGASCSPPRRRCAPGPATSRRACPAAERRSSRCSSSR